MGQSLQILLSERTHPKLVVLARNNFQWQVDENPITAHFLIKSLITKTQFTFNMMVKSETVCLVVLMSITLSCCLPLDLGFGGVFKTPEADAYWERRFGRGFFSNLASIQKNIDSQAKLNKAKLGAESPIPVTIDLRQNVEEEISNNEISEMSDAAVKSAVEDLTFSPSRTLFLEDVRS